MVTDDGGMRLRRVGNVTRLHRWLESVADRLGLTPVDLARITLATSQTARAAMRQSRAPRATVRVRRRREEAFLAVRFDADGDCPLPVPHPPSPVTARRDASGAVHIELPLPAVADELVGNELAEPPDGEPAAERAGEVPLEVALRAALDEVDERGEQVRRLGEELEETNRGVMALYVELEQRDEELRRANRAVVRELEDALRPPPPEVLGVELGVAYLPAQENSPTGGDLYDWLVLPGGELHVTVVDVLGHGVTGTRDALSVTHTIRTLCLEGHPFADLIQHAAANLEGHNPALVATVLLARVDPDRGILRVATGSHPPLLARNPGEEARYVECRGRGMGYPQPGADNVGTAELHPQGLALLYTDGLIESTRNIIEGMERLPEVLGRAAELPTVDVPKAVVDDMLSGGAHSDDTVAISIRWTP